MSEIASIAITDIDANPFRRLGDYPFVERKLDALQRSIGEVGLWEGVIVRKARNRYEAAFGHHRIEGGRRAGLTHIPVIVRDLTDEQMLKFMGRENMEDYNADFLCMLETWEAGVVFFPAQAGKTAEPIDIANLLGWTHGHTKHGGDQMNDTARACHAAYVLIRGGYLGRDDLRDLTVRAAREIVERAHSRMESLDRLAKDKKRSAAELEDAKRHIGRAARETGRQVREGQLAQKDIRGTVDVNAYRFARQSKRMSPLFEQFGKDLANSIARMLKDDSASKRLEEIAKVVNEVSLDDDKRTLVRIAFELGELIERSAIWNKRLIPADKKVTRLQVTKGE